MTTDANGVATAPYFSANETAGGYIVTAKVAGLAAQATFALVNTARTAASVSGPAGTYWLVTSAGKVLTSGSAANHGSVTSKRRPKRWPWPLPRPVAATGWSPPPATCTPLATPRRMVSRPRCPSPIVGMAATPDGKGYWLVASDGAVYAYGDATAHGSPAKAHLASPIVGMAATADGKGYWLVASDGGIFNYGDAAFHGSAGHVKLKKPIVGMAATADGKGYWLVASDGGIFAFGSATFYGSQPSLTPQPVKALVATPDGDGYWVVSANGTAAGFGDAGAQGSALTPGGVTVVGGAA